MIQKITHPNIKKYICLNYQPFYYFMNKAHLVYFLKICNRDDFV